MCFSAQASFVVAGALTITGLLAVRMVKDKHFLRLSCIPLFFALQQALEGIVWLSIDKMYVVQLLATYGFVFFAFMFWPVWISWSLLPIEQTAWRRLMLYTTLAGGVIFALIALFALLIYGARASVVDHHIVYNFSLPAHTLSAHALQMQALYFFAVIIPALISSRPFIQGFGTAVAVTYVIAQIFYRPFIISAWCFFAAIVSIFIFVAIQQEQKKS